VVSVDVTASRSCDEARTRTSRSRTSRRAERRRLARRDELSARLAELHGIRDLLTRAETVVSAGWVQHGWFTVADELGGTHRVDALNLGDLTGRPVSGGCLVGALVHAAGGPATVRSQLVQRTLDLTWHALHEDERRPVRWCPGPDVRGAHLRDLTRWNDSPRRTADQVAGLLRAAGRLAEVPAGATQDDARALALA
jgi:hypothetical protein